MIDFRKNMKTMALNKADVSCLSIYFRVTTVKLDQKLNLKGQGLVSQKVQKP